MEDVISEDSSGKYSQESGPAKLPTVDSSAE